MSPRSGREPRLTHISTIAEDVDESAEFYEEVIGCRPISTPQFGKQKDFDAEENIAFQMMRIGDHQLHLWNDPAREIEATRFAHFGIHVDDFEDVYRRAEDRDAFAAIGVESAPPQVFDFNGTAQLYLRDPTGNLVEIDYPDIDELDRSVFADVVSRETTGPDLGVYTDSLFESISKN
jgi:catechol 2,3-dioxygenase-like lactoylglutathione lyase family enzyme